MGLQGDFSQLLDKELLLVKKKNPRGLYEAVIENLMPDIFFYVIVDNYLFYFLAKSYFSKSGVDFPKITLID